VPGPRSQWCLAAAPPYLVCLVARTICKLRPGPPRRPSLQARGESPCSIQRSWPWSAEEAWCGPAHTTANAQPQRRLFISTATGSGRAVPLRLFAHARLNEARAGAGCRLCWTDPPQPYRFNAAGWMWPTEAGLLVRFPASTDHAVTAQSRWRTSVRLSISFDLVSERPWGISAGHLRLRPPPPNTLAPPRPLDPRPPPACH